MTKRDVGESWAEDIESVEQEIQRLDKERQECEQSLRQLRAQEDPASGQVHAQEIHAQQVKKLGLQIELEFYRKRKNRLLLEQGWE